MRPASTAGQERQTTDDDTGRPRWWRKPLLGITTLVGLLLLVDGARRIFEGIGEFGAAGRHHIAVGAVLILAGLLGVWTYGRKLGDPAHAGADAAPGIPDDPSTPLRIPASRRMTTQLMIGAVLMCASSLAIMLLPWLDRDSAMPFPASVALVIGLVGLVFFGACLWWLVQRRLDATDALVADPLGLYDRSTAIGTDERVPWRDISGFHPLTFMGQRFVAVELVDPQRFIDRAQGLRRLALAANQRLVGTPWCITPATLGWSAAALSQALAARRAQFGNGTASSR